MNIKVACTAEYLRLPSSHAGVLKRPWRDDGWHPKYGEGIIHFNAPLIFPSAEGNQVLEIFYSKGFRIRQGMPICGMEIHALDQESENPYNGKYKGQQGPQTSRIHLDARNGL